MERPDGWEESELGYLAAPEPRSITDGPFGSNLKTSHYTESGPRVVRLQNIGDGRFEDDQAHISEEHFASLDRHSVEPGDVLIAALGKELPRSCIAPDWLGPAIVKADCIRFRPGPRVDGRFVSYMLNSRPVRRGVAEIIHGVGRPRLNLREIKAIQLPVPPRDEQQRIVEVIEEQFSRLDASVASLHRAKRNLARLRASILQAAVEGRLTRRNTSDRHARDLLADIANTKGSAPKASVRQTTDRSNRWRLALPINWAVAFPDEVTAADPYALSIGPFGSNLKVSDYRSNGVPLVFVRNIRSRSFGGPDTKFVSKDKAAELAAHRADPGDVLITKMGDPPGDAAIYEGVEYAFELNQDLSGISVRQPAASRRIDGAGSKQAGENCAQCAADAVYSPDIQSIVVAKQALYPYARAIADDSG